MTVSELPDLDLERAVDLRDLLVRRRVLPLPARPAPPPDPVPAAVHPARTPRVPGAAARVLGDVALAVPLLLVNAFAVLGQQQWATRYATNGDVVLAWGMAAALESVGVYLAYEAHRALLAGDAALRLRLSSYGVGLLVGTLNYRVHAPDWSPSPAAIAFGALSAASPWLWAVRSRSLHRDQLRAQGLIDERTVRFTVARWLLWFRPTWRVMRLSVWHRVTHPAEALDRFGDAALTASQRAPRTSPTGDVGRGAERAAAELPAPPGEPSTPPPAPREEVAASPPATTTPRKARALPAAPLASLPASTVSTINPLDAVDEVVRQVLAEHPSAGLPRVARAVRAAGCSISDRSLRDRITAARITVARVDAGRTP